MGNPAIMKRASPDPAGGRIRLLIPIDASDESRWGVRYAIRRFETGTPVEVCLLFVAEPVRNWEVLRFYSEEEVRKHFQERAAAFLEEAARPLREAGIPYRSHFREADPVRGVIDCAEELNCTEIVVPQTTGCRLFSSALGERLRRQGCRIPVTRAKADGSLPA